MINITIKKIAIIGSSELAKQVIHQALQNNLEVYGIYDDFSKQATVIEGIEIKGSVDQITQDFTEDKFNFLFVAVGYSRMEYRASIFNRFKNKIPFANIIHKSCIIDPTVVLGEGIFLFPGVLLDKGVRIEDNVLLNIAVTIAHDSTVKSHCFFGPRVSLAGFSEIGSKSFIGTNATIIDNIKICSGVVLGAGSVLIKNIEQPGVYVGIPAREIDKK